MTKHEVKEEMRESQGDPRFKGEIRKRQRAMSRLRMMAEVSRADLIITNPTHYAVALRYDRTRSTAPRVVAKGTDEVAARIREEATRHGVPIVEDPPLARAVYGACDLQDEIPEALYMAVARLLAFVYSLSPALKSVRPDPPPRRLRPRGLTARRPARRTCAAVRRRPLRPGPARRSPWPRPVGQRRGELKCRVGVASSADAVSAGVPKSDWTISSAQATASK